MITYQINGTDIEYITKANWQTAGRALGFDGNTSISRVVGHTWAAPEGMPQTEFNTLYALEGSIVTLQTTDYSDRNNQKLYYGVELDSVRANHTGPVLVNVQLDFKILI